jgi:RimJ/RimL family protein N-acetyltransferase
MLPDRFGTARLLLRLIAPGDAPAIFAGYAQDLEVVRYLTRQPHRNIGETEAFIARCVVAPADQVRTYALIERAEGFLIGAFELRRPQPFRLDFGYVLARPFWRRGLMTEALGAVSRWAMGQPEVWRIGAVCDTENLASARVMEKSGIIREGVLRRWICTRTSVPSHAIASAMR